MIPGRRNPARCVSRRRDGCLQPWRRRSGETRPHLTPVCLQDRLSDRSAATVYWIAIGEEGFRGDGEANEEDVHCGVVRLGVLPGCVWRLRNASGSNVTAGRRFFGTGL